MKKAEISSGMMLGLILIIISLVVLLFVYYQIVWQKDYDRETCKTSAILKGTLPSDGMVSSQVKDLISIKCKTKKICVTANKWPKKGECANIFGNNEEIITYRVSKDSAEEQIKTLLAREMADCWDMLGKGNIAIFKRSMDISKDIGAVGVICSRIHFDKTITENLGLKEIKGFNLYLLTHKVPNQNLSYWDFLRNSYDGETMSLLFGESVKGTSSKDLNSFLNNTIELKNTKSVVFVEARPSFMGKILGGGSGILVGAVAAFYVGSDIRTKAAIIGGSMAVGGFIGDWIQLKLLEKEGKFKDSTFSSGIYLTDYSYSGFRDFSDSEASFEIASIP